MSFNFNSGFDITPFNIVIVGTASYSGLQLLQCVNWAEGPAHGGEITETPADTIFDYISNSENQNGMTDYRKAFIKNFGNVSTEICNIRPSLVLPPALITRLGISIALGTTTDDMTDKPSDGAFGVVLNTTIAAGESVPVWLKRIVVAGGVSPGSYLGIQLVLTVSEL